MGLENSTRPNNARLKQFEDTLRRYGVPRRIVDAMLKVPREKFVLPPYEQWAYADTSLTIGFGQTISQPSLVGRMIDALKTEPDHTVLDVGTGSGYQAAILSKLVRRVVTVERVPELVESASKVLSELGCANVELHPAGEELGWPDDAPYDGIIVGAAAPRVPVALVNQLKIGRRLVIPVGSAEVQNIYVVERTESGHHHSVMEAVKFVPLVGQGAWPNRGE